MNNILPYIIIILLVCGYRSYSQRDTISENVRNSVYAEALGIGGYGSVNYEYKVISKEKVGLSFRCGFSCFQIRDFMNNINPHLIFPFSVYGLYGKLHHVELGFGQTISNMVRANNIDYQPTRHSGFNSSFSIGYRYQAEDGGIIFRFCYSPLIEKDKYFRHWGGISLGYAF